MRTLVSVFLLVVSAYGADQQLLKLMMPDARVVSGIHVAQVKKTPFGQFVLKRFAESQDQGFDEFVKASGFDPRYNLDEIVIASPAGTGSARRLVAARGTFAPARIQELARSAGGVVTPYQGVDVISNGKAAAASPHGLPMAVAFLSESIAVAGDEESVRAAIGRRDTGAGPSREIAAKVGTVSAASDAWFVSTVPVTELVQGLPDANLSDALEGDAFKSIGQASGGATFGDTVKVSGEIVTASAEDATNLAGVLRFLSGMAQGQQSLFKTLDLKPEGKLLKFGLAVPETQLEEFIDQAGR